MYDDLFSNHGQRIAGFEWDEGNRGKCQKHGLTIAAIEGMFEEPIDIRSDPYHSTEEARYWAIGRGDDGRGVFLVFTLRPLGESVRIRPISARYMHKKEIERYEKAAKAASDTPHG